jgi:hexokinase
VIQGLPVRIVALVNDTVGTLMASAYVDTKTQIGSIYGTGSNAAYMERCDQIPKMKISGLYGDAFMAINCEYGAFDNSERVLPFTRYDVEIDQSSSRPGQQRYEKLVAGLYLGEMMRLILVDLYDRHKIFQGRNGSGLKQPYVLDSCSLANIENDQTRSLTSIRNMLQETFNITSDFSESYFCRCVARLISRRSVRLYACGIAALLKKRGMQHCHVAVDGSVFSKYPRFPDRVMEALKEVLGLPEEGDDHIRLVPAVDGSSVGAAVIAAVAMAREEEGYPGI